MAQLENVERLPQDTQQPKWFEQFRSNSKKRKLKLVRNNSVGHSNNVAKLMMLSIKNLFEIHIHLVHFFTIRPNLMQPFPKFHTLRLHNQSSLDVQKLGQSIRRTRSKEQNLMFHNQTAKS